MNNNNNYASTPNKLGSAMWLTLAILISLLVSYVVWKARVNVKEETKNLPNTFSLLTALIGDSWAMFSISLSPLSGYDFGCLYLIFFLIRFFLH